jgi:hypothetical protein
MSVIPAGSLIGDISSPVSVEVAAEPEAIAVEESEEKSEFDLNGKAAKAESPTQTGKTPVVGQMYVNNLLCALFPERR